MRVTVSMFEKGRSFVMAGGLVKAYEGHRFVYLHLLCQGLECIGKALLLAHDYEKYAPKLRKDFGHDLEVLIKEVNGNRPNKMFTDNAMKELIKLNCYYKRHMLRYGDASDFKEEAHQITADCLHRELVECLTDLNAKFSTLESDA